MNTDWLLHAEEICNACGGHCCCEANPPISEPCYERLVREGISPDSFEMNGYRRLKSRPDGACVLWNRGRCTIHGIKPETCRAGPFTFDVQGDTVEIFLKLEKICPLVRLLKDEPAAYGQQYARAVENILHLVQNLSENELAAICRIEEPDTEKVAEIPRPGRST